VRASLSQSFLFDAAHTLERTAPLPEYEASARVHGHTYTARVTVTGELRDGMIWLPKAPGLRARECDLFALRASIDKVRAALDHRMLNEVPGLGRPTMESLCVFIGERIRAVHFPITAVEVSRQTGDSARVEW